MVAEADTGKFVSARTHPTLVLVTTSIDDEAKSLCISAPGKEELRLPLGAPTSGVVIDGRSDSSTGFIVCYFSGVFSCFVN